MESRILIVTSPNDWHWAISLEYVWDQILQGSQIAILDVSYAGESGIRPFLKKHLDKKSLRVKVLKFVLQEHIKLYKIGNTDIGKERFPNFAKIIFANKKYFEKNDCPEIFNSVVEISGKLRPDIFDTKCINAEYRKFRETIRFLDRFDFSGVNEIVTVNGRFTKNATVKMWAEKSKIGISFIEFGSSKNKFEHFEIGPHSMIETGRKIEKAWSSAPPNKVEIASNFLKREIRDRDPVGIDWRAQMKIGIVPETNYEKVCTFFASTEAEYAGVGDVVPEGFFANQKEAFEGLLKALDPNVWQIFLRRHPSPPGKKFLDAESHLWDDFTDLKNVKVIPPNSIVDSFALGMKSDLVANFCSTLAMDFIAAGKQQVITLGTAPWNATITSRFTPTVEHITKFLTGQNISCSAADTYPWAYFCATFGTEFNVLQFSSKKNTWEFNQLQKIRKPT